MLDFRSHFMSMCSLRRVFLLETHPFSKLKSKRKRKQCTNEKHCLNISNHNHTCITYPMWEPQWNARNIEMPYKCGVQMIMWNMWNDWKFDEILSIHSKFVFPEVHELCQRWWKCTWIMCWTNRFNWNSQLLATSIVQYICKWHIHIISEKIALIASRPLWNAFQWWGASCELLNSSWRHCIYCDCHGCVNGTLSFILAIKLTSLSSSLSQCYNF